MADIKNVMLCAAAMTLFWTLIGLPIAVRIAPANLAAFLAPALGWSVFSTATLAFLSIVGMAPLTVIALTLASAVAAIAGLWRWQGFFDKSLASGFVLVAIGSAALLALVPMAAILPKETADGVRLAGPIFDHSKIAMIDEIIRNGLPPANPFFYEFGAPDRLSYYYLWHYSAALMATMTGVSGWEADAALTWFTAFASLLLMIGFAVWFSGCSLAGIFVVALAATCSLRPVIEAIIGADTAYSVIGWATGFGGWQFQITWAPQHVASAMLVVLACYLIAQLPARRDPLVVVALGLVVAAACQSSIWVGGVTLALSALVIGLRILWELPASSRVSLVARTGIAASLAGALIGPFLYDQFTITATRDGEWPIAFKPTAVVGDAFPESIIRFVDLPAFWLIYLPVEFPAFYLAGLIALFLLLRDQKRPDGRRVVMQTFALLLASSLVCSWLLVGNLGGNNDLGWRAVLPAVLVLICFAAAGLAKGLAAGNRSLAVLTAAGVMLGLPDSVSFVIRNLTGEPSASERGFAQSPAMWEAVRRHSSATDRIANNPLFLREITPTPANMSWALLSDRRSCYAGYHLGIPFAPVPAKRRLAIDELFSRVFEGRAAQEDVQQLAARHGCDLAIVTVSDGAWTNDPFASSGHYRLLENSPGAWRVYRKFGP